MYVLTSMAKFPHGLHIIMHIGMVNFLSLVIEVWLICPSMNTPRHLSINEGSLFCLSHRDLPNHNGPHNPLGTVGKPSMRRVH